MKSKNEKGTAKNDSTQQPKNTGKKSATGNTGSSSATGNTKARSGHGSSNEGTNTSYEEER